MAEWMAVYLVGAMVDTTAAALVVGMGNYWDNLMV